MSTESIVLIQKTFLKPKRPKSCALAANVQLRADMTDALLGDTVIFYARSLHYCQIDLPNLTNIETTECRLAMTGHGTLFIVSIYLSPTKKLLRSDLEAFLAIGDVIIFFGDFNWKTSTEDARSSILVDGGQEVLTDGLAFVDCQKLPIDALGLLKAKNAALRHAYTYRTRENSIEFQCFHTSPPHDSQNITLIEEDIRHETSLEPRDGLSPVSLDEVQKLVKNLKAKRTPVLDGISNKAIKCFPLIFFSLLVAIFIACLKNCYFPLVWKEVELMGIHNPEKPRDLPVSYRPISLLSGLGKLYEKQILRLVEYITEGFKTKKRTVAVFFDVGKAFDRILYAGLIYKLYLLKVTDRLTLVIHQYLTNKHVMFRHENTHSFRRRISTAVPQGSTLSTLLYSAYTNDIPRTSLGIQLALFADNTAMHLCGQTEKTSALTSIGSSMRRLDGSEPVGSRNSVLHRDLDFPTINKFMKDTSELFFSIAESYPNPLLSAVASYEAPPPYHFIRGPRNIVIDPRDDFAAKIERLRETYKQNDN
ncbi:Probable RNA-directed DNA polymerase from transposon BS [Eumeta japonica]|uniref:Probable RNA-directed DNA polymerase from transposon BS n=1 Tax=Eumeta variegata TaxID=151549 RepID=A0A4C1VM95_EUMVA|nr:Probable RNA-directed DNA polymerase from transposon BS [Eumeta japonica]